MAPHDLAQLVDTVGPRLALYARQWCAAPDDVVQDAFLKLIALRRSPQDPVRWLFRVVRNGAIDAGKIDRRRKQRESVAGGTARWFRSANIEGLDAAAAIAGLERLPIEQREVIVARLWGGLNFEEIAELSGCSASTAFRRFSAGIDVLRQELGMPCPTTRSSTD
jgi:RNA polymerase sigma-70 factor (ECF subfamily)